MALVSAGSTARLWRTEKKEERELGLNKEEEEKKEKKMVKVGPCCLVFEEEGEGKEMGKGKMGYRVLGFWVFNFFFLYIIIIIIIIIIITYLTHLNHDKFSN